MIRINRATPAPAVLSASRARDRYRSDEVVETLLQMQHRKCCYCEVAIADRGSGKQVEHFRPRSRFGDLTNDWYNLLLACANCNSAKGNKFPVSDTGEPILLDPSDPTVDPEDHINYVVRQPTGSAGIGLLLGLAIARDDSPRGQATIEAIGLFQEHHIRMRQQTLRGLRHCYELLLMATEGAQDGNGDVREMERWKEKLREAIRDHSIYTGLARTFHREYRLEEFGIHR